MWQVEHAARLLRESGYDEIIDIVYTSRLQRAIHSAWVVLRALEQHYLPVWKTWRLNARHYGAVSGCQIAHLVEQQVGPEQVQLWRTDPNARPPPLSSNHPDWPGRQRRYRDAMPSSLPASESIRDCTERLAPAWFEILCELQMGHNVLVVGHGSTLRAMVQLLQGLTYEQASQVNIPPGSPLVYEFTMTPPRRWRGRQGNQNGTSKISLVPSLQVIPTMDPTSTRLGLWGRFLERPGVLEEALEQEEQRRTLVMPGWDDYRRKSSWSEPATNMSTTTTGVIFSAARSSMARREQSLTVLAQQRELELLHATTTDEEMDINDNDNTDLQGRAVGVARSNGSEIKPFIIKGHPCLVTLPEGVTLPTGIALPARKATVIVMIRHGKTEHNKLGLFTGWEDPALTEEGVAEAKRAGELLRTNGFEFDVVYSSWLQRAIETAWHVLDELDSTWIPIVKSWRLNERMYGDLTGKSKAMIARVYGEKQLKTWRRGFKNKPPPVNPFSQYYPGNDRKYQKYMNDLRYSVSESILRSIANQRPTLSRKFPKTESLHCCMKRTIPYLTNVIIPEAVDQGKRVLIASSENAIRGMLMHLCDIPEELISQLNIPNGVPLVYDVQSKCLKLLEDADATAAGVHPLSRYDFGPAAEYLFRSPETKQDNLADEQCDIENLSYDAMKALADIFKTAERNVSSDSQSFMEIKPHPLVELVREKQQQWQEASSD